MENYLEVIFLLQQKHGHAHIRDIADKMKITMPSVTEALGKLKTDKLISHKRYGTVLLTAKGITLAKEVLSSHQILYKFLRQILKIDADTAENDACKIEHVISPKTLKKLITFVGTD